MAQATTDIPLSPDAHSSAVIKQDQPLGGEVEEETAGDWRLYLTKPGWLAAVNLVDHRFYCHQMNDTDDAYHRIAVGEIFLQLGDKPFCLNCARKRQLLTHHRPTLGNAEFLDLQTSRDDETALPNPTA